MSLARDRYNHHCRQLPLWGDDRSWMEWRQESDRLWREQAGDPVDSWHKLPAAMDDDYARAIDEIKATMANAGQPGYNEYGVPRHACHGAKHDAHVSARITAHLGK